MRVKMKTDFTGDLRYDTDSNWYKKHTIARIEGEGGQASYTIKIDGGESLKGIKREQFVLLPQYAGREVGAYRLKSGETVLVGDGPGESMSAAAGLAVRRLILKQTIIVDDTYKCRPDDFSGAKLDRLQNIDENSMLAHVISNFNYRS
jgi:hypothetical protein